jgi:hypothetical protein
MTVQIVSDRAGVTPHPVTHDQPTHERNEAMRRGINHKVSHDSGPLPKTLTGIKHGSRGNLSHSVAGQPKYLRRKPDMTEREAILDSFGMTHLPGKFHATPEAPRRPKMNSTLIASSTRKTGTVIDAYPDAKPGDLTPMRQSAKIQPRYRDDQQVRVTTLAREVGLTPKAVIDALMQEQGEYVKSIHSNVAGPVARMFREMHPEPSMVMTPGEVLAQLIGTEKAIVESHASITVEGTAGCHVGCGVTTCACGAHYVTHNAKCRHADPRGLNECPVKAATRKVMYASSTQGAK